MPAEGESVNDSRRRQLLLQNYTPPPQKFNQYSFVRHAHMVNKEKKKNRSLYVAQICDRTWEKGPLRAQYDFSVEAVVVYLT